MNSRLYIRRSLIFLIIGLAIGYFMGSFFSLNQESNIYNWTSMQTKLAITLLGGYLFFSFYAGADFLYRFVMFTLNDILFGMGCILAIIGIGFSVILVAFIMPIGLIISIPRFLLNLSKIKKGKVGYY